MKHEKMFFKYSKHTSIYAIYNNMLQKFAPLKKSKN